MKVGFVMICPELMAIAYEEKDVMDSEIGTRNLLGELMS
jgi:hypothetical protein